MAADRPADPLEPEGRAPSEQAAAEVRAMVAEQVRRAIDSAERSAEELQREALDRASGDRESVHRTAATVLDRIDVVEEKVGKLLQTLREEVARTAGTVDRPRVANDVQPVSAPAGQASDDEPAAQPAHSAEPGPPAPPVGAKAVGPAARRRRRGLFRRRQGSDCVVCGRAPPAGKETLEGWRRSGKVSLCPDCQHEGWRLPAGARLPYRPARHPGY